MKITKVSIKNYRPCIDTSFDPNSCLSALIGPNGSGKTNVLSAIKLLPALCLNRGGRHSFGDNPDTPLSEIKTWYEIDGKKMVHTARLHLVTNEKNQDEIIDSEESWYMYEFTGRKNRVSFPSWLLLRYFSRKFSRWSNCQQENC